jgi:hypothetical protein
MADPESMSREELIAGFKELQNRVREYENEMESVRVALTALGCDITREQLSACCRNADTFLAFVTWLVERRRITHELPAPCACSGPAQHLAG